MELFQTLEAKHGLPAGLLDAVWATESSRGKNLNNSSAGARGHFQFMPETAKQYGIYGKENDLTASAAAAARMYSDLLRQSGGDLNRALAGYNWGSGNVQRKGMQNMPTETRNYIQKVRATMGAPQQPQRRGMPIIGMQGQPAQPRMQRIANDDPFAALRQKYGAKQAPAVERQPAQQQDDPFAELRAKYSTPAAQPAPQETQDYPVAQQQAHAQQPAPEQSKNSFFTLLNTVVPILGMTALLEQKSKEATRTGKTAMGAMDPVHGGAQFLSNVPLISEPINKANNWLADTTGLTARLPEGGVNQQVREREAAYQARRKAAGESGFDGWRTVGNVVSPANIALSQAGIGSAATTYGRILNGTMAGATSAAFNPVTDGAFWTEKGKQVGTGALFGGAVPAVAAGVGRVVSPAASRNPDLQMLRKAGVRPTLGQSLGGAWNSAEEKATSIPLVGDFISRQRKRALQEFNNAAINRVGEPIGQRVKGAGVDAVAEIGDLASAAQERAKNMIGAFQIDNQASASLSKIESMARAIPDKQARRSVLDAVNLVKTQASQRGFMTPESYKEVVSDIGKDAAYLAGSSNGYQRKAGAALSEIVETLKAAGSRQNPSASKAMSAADAAWANLVRVEGASKAAANNGGVFTPAQLMAAVRQADTSVRDRATARGTALMQDLASAGQNVLGNKVPNSFTTDRALLSLGTLGGAYLNPQVATGVAGGSLMYTTPAQRLLAATVGARPQSAQTVRDAIIKASPGLVPLGSQVGLGLLNH